MNFKIFFCRYNAKWILLQYSLATGLLIHSENGINYKVLLNNWTEVSRSYFAFNQATSIIYKT